MTFINLSIHNNEIQISMSCINNVKLWQYNQFQSWDQRGRSLTILEFPSHLDERKVSGSLVEGALKWVNRSKSVAAASDGLNYDVVVIGLTRL